MIIDLHCHIIPEIDDGAKDLDSALEMCRIAAADGIHGIIATPHFIQGAMNNTKDIINSKVVELNDYLAEAGIDIEIYPGCEAFICPELPRLVREGLVATLNDTQYILIELPMNSVPDYTADVIYELKLDGYTPIIAHPERNQVIAQDSDILIDFINRGALTQVNATSLKGLFGKPIADTAIKLLKHNMVHFLASDAHTTGGRSPKLSKAMDIIEKEVGKEALLNVMRNGEALLNNQPIYVEEPVKVKAAAKTGFFGGFRKLVSGMFDS